MKRMLINATQAEEKRLAVVEGQVLLDYETETVGQEQRKSNIYKGVVTRIEPSLEACFVDYGEEKHGFLSFKEISRQYFAAGVKAEEAVIQDAISVGQELLVQVEKEERGNKGAALTTFISIAGRYVVLMPNNPRGGGISRRVEEEDRNKLKEVMRQLQYPRGMSIIARTAGIGRSVEELQWDLNYLLKLWNAIINAAESLQQPSLIYQESNLVIRALRDYFGPDIDEILIDEKNIYEQAKQFVTYVMPDQVERIKFYSGHTALFSRFQLEKQIESAYTRSVSLPSGGSIVIDHTEALVAVDVNSARAIRGGDVEETAITTNLEAAEEIARQMRLRDLGGLIVIDFIDMEEARNRHNLEQHLRELLREDRARIHISSISRFGLIELSRQRLKPALNESVSIPCPRCSGAGHIRSTDSSALQILRVIQEEAVKDSTEAILVQVPVDAASFLLNEKRLEISKIEAKSKIKVIVVPNKTLETPNYHLERLKADDPRLENMPVSYQVAEDFEEDITTVNQAKEPRNKQKPVIEGVLRDTPRPPTKEPSLWSKLWERIIGLFKTQPQPKKSNAKSGNKRRYPNNRNYKKKPNQSTNEGLKNTVEEKTAAGPKDNAAAKNSSEGRTRGRNKNNAPANAAKKNEDKQSASAAAKDKEPVKTRTGGANKENNNKGNGRNGGRRSSAKQQKIVPPTELAEPVVKQQPAAVAAAVETVVAEKPLPVVKVADVVAQEPLPPLAKDVDFKLEIAKLSSVAQEAGLQWVHSDGEKVAAAKQRAQANQVPPQLGRELPTLPPVVESDLILVQTKVDLTAAGYPFQVANKEKAV